MLIESVPCFTEYNRYNSVMELDSLSLIFFPYKYIYITLIRIQRVRIHRNSSDEKNWIISNRFVTKKLIDGHDLKCKSRLGSDDICPFLYN